MMHTFSTLPLTSPESSSGLLQSEISEALDVGAMTVVQKSEAHRQAFTLSASPTLFVLRALHGWEEICVPP